MISSNFVLCYKLQGKNGFRYIYSETQKDAEAQLAAALKRTFFEVLQGVPKRVVTEQGLFKKTGEGEYDPIGKPDSSVIEAFYRALEFSKKPLTGFGNS